MQIISKPTNLIYIWENRKTDFVELLKIVVDIEKEIIAIDAEMHADLEELMLINGSEQQNIWGANVYPMIDKYNDNFMEYTSFINIRPSQNNSNMEVLDNNIREKMKQIVNYLLL